MAVPSGAQKWLREPASENASVVRCVPARWPRAPRRRRGLDHGGGRVVHQHDHRRRATHRRPAGDDVDGVSESRAATTGLGDSKAQDAGLGQGVDTPAGKGAVGVDRGRIRADDVLNDGAQARRGSQSCSSFRAK